MSTRGTSKSWSFDRCYKEDCKNPVWVDPRTREKWTFCEQHLREGGIGPGRRRHPDPHHNDPERW